MASSSSPTATSLPYTGNADADRLLASDALAFMRSEVAKRWSASRSTSR